MDHTATTQPTPEGRDGTMLPGPVANPRRTRLGADGRPIPRPATPSGA
jgi:hypothetical protein